MEYYKNLDLSDIKYFCEFDLIWKIEQWKDVVGYKGYMVSDLGRVKGLDRFVYNGLNANKKVKSKILSQGLASHGYLIVSCSFSSKPKTRTVHKLVAESFLNHIPCKHKLVINHKNFNKLDNRKINLEIVTQRINANRLHLKYTSKYIGVYFRKDSKKWRSSIHINGKHFNLGTFKTEIEAHNAYQKKLKEITNI